MIGALVLAALAAGPPGERIDPAVELRALRGYLGFHANCLEAAGEGRPGAKSWAEDIGRDLQFRLDHILDHPDLSADAQGEAIAAYHDLARSSAASADPADPEAPARLRDLYSALVRRADAAGRDVLPLELEMLALPSVGLDARETFAAIARMAPRIRERTLGAAEWPALEGILGRILAEPGWPDLEGGEAITSTIDLLLKVEGADRSRSAAVIASKLADWTARLLRAEEAREGESAQEAGIIHLYRSLEVAAGDLDPAGRAAALEGLVPLVAPVLAEGPPAAAGEGALRSVEIGEVRIPSGTAPRIPPLPPGCGPEGGTRFLLVPKKTYQVQLLCSPVKSGPRAAYWVLARAGTDGRLVIPRVIPPGIAPITLAETGRVGFLADRKPWSIRRFLLAFQRCGNALAADKASVSRIVRNSALRELPLGDGDPNFASLVDLLGNGALRERLEGTFWIDGRDEAGRKAAFEIAGAILSSNTGLRDTAFALPTVAEANRILRDGAWFDVVEPSLGVFNASRLVPEPGDNGGRTRYVVRTVARISAP